MAGNVARRIRRATIGLVLVVAVQGLVLDGGTVAGVAAATPCKRPAHGFVPTRAQIPAIGRTVRVIQVQRTSNNTVGAGPVTEAGKWLMAMDPHTLPASRHGTVLLSGHTWPDGSALGNAMLANLQAGDQIVLAGKNGKHACYRIDKRVSYRADRVPSRKAFRSSGPEQVVIVACSGKRLGPGHWTRRTIWYGVPVKPAAPQPPPSAPPPSSPPPSGGLLGGLLGLL